MSGSLLLLQQRKKSDRAAQQESRAPAGITEARLLDMSIRLERYLWERANGDLEQYSDLTTLKPRLQALAIVMSQSVRAPGAPAQG